MGSKRVKALFDEAKANAPAIIFIDEIDSLGAKRMAGGQPGGADETLNQLLVEMDGFETNDEVVVFAATNREDILDTALTRSGRFDRRVQVSLPTIEGRYDIFKIYLGKLKLTESEIDKYAKRLAAVTPGFSGSDIANICNEAAILSVRNNRDHLIASDFENAVDRVIGGLEVKMKLSKKDKEKISVHECGHGIVAWFLEGGSPLLKLTVIPRSKGSLGYAQYLPPETSLHTEQEIKDMIAVALGGRIAEEEFFGEISAGAADDLQKVYKYASTLVTNLGMSSKVGQLNFPNTDQRLKSYSEETNQMIDEEIKALVHEAGERARAIIREKRDIIQKLSEVLIEKETIDTLDVEAVAGKRPFEAKDNFKKFLQERKAVEEDLQNEKAAQEK